MFFAFIYLIYILYESSDFFIYAYISGFLGGMHNFSMLRFSMLCTQKIYEEKSQIILIIMAIIITSQANIHLTAIH